MSARAPLVSVLMTSYNRERYIGAAIESVLAQHFEDFELLVVDNCSTDRSVEIAREYERRDRRVRVVVNERNLGQFGNRNRAAELARGRLLRYADSDDLLYPHCLSTLVPLLLAEPRAGFLVSQSREFLGGPSPMFHTPRMAYQRHFLGPNEFFVVGPACGLFRTEVFRALGGFEQRGVASDVLFWLRACARVPMVAAPGDLFWYRRHPDQELQSGKAAREYTIVAGEYLRALDAPECPLTPEERLQAKRNVVGRLARELVDDVRHGRWALARLRVAHAGLSVAEWSRLLRRPRRALLAGTPLDARGDYVVPDWSHFRLGATPRAEQPAGDAPASPGAPADGRAALSR